MIFFVCLLSILHNVKFGVFFKMFSSPQLLLWALKWANCIFESSWAVTSFFPWCQKHCLLKQTIQIKDSLKGIRIKCSLLVHQYKHSTLDYNNECTAAPVSLINGFSGVLPKWWMHNLVLYEIITLMFPVTDSVAATLKHNLHAPNPSLLWVEFRAVVFLKTVLVLD